MTKEISEVKKRRRNMKEENSDLKEVKDNLIKELNVSTSKAEELKVGSRKTR